MAIYEYAARCLRVINSDSVELEVDLGFGIRLSRTMKIIDRGIGECFIHEKKTQEAKRRIQELLIDKVNPQFGGFPLLIHTEKSSSFGYQAEVLVFVDFSNKNPHNTQQWASVRSILLDEGLAIPYEA